MPCRKFCVTVLLVTMTGSLTTDGAVAAEAVRFAVRSVQVGDRTEQQIQFDLNLEMTIEMSGQKVDTSARLMERQEQYRMTVLEHQLGGTTKVRLTYDQAKQAVTDDQRSKQNKPLPVAGKTYLVARIGEKLQITQPLQQANISRICGRLSGKSVKTLTAFTEIDFPEPGDIASEEVRLFSGEDGFGHDRGIDDVAA